MRMKVSVGVMTSFFSSPEYFTVQRLVKFIHDMHLKV